MKSQTKSIISQYAEDNERKLIPFREINEIAKNNQTKARQLLVKNNIKLAFKLAYRYQNNCDFEDVLSNALLGLQVASERFDFKRGNQFTTFAFFWIKKYIIMFVKKELKQRTIGTEDDQDLKFVLSLDSTFQDSDESFHEIASNELENLNEFEALQREDERKFIHQLINDFLSDSEREILENRYLNDQQMTFNDLANKMNQKVSKIKLLEKQAFEKLKFLIEKMNVI